MIFLTVVLPVFAEENQRFSAPNLSEYSLDELLEFKDELANVQNYVDNLILEKQRQWAIENGNRVIDFDVSDFTLHTTQTKTITPTVTRVVDDAPATTQFIWTSSDDSVARVNPYGMVTAVGSGRATITCAAEDGSGKTGTISFFVPSIRFSEKQVTVTDRDGYTIDVPFFGDPKAFEVKPTVAPNFNIIPTWDEQKQVFHLKVIPSKYGSGTIFLKDNNDHQNDRSFNLMIEHSAAYDTTSFPRPRYTEAMRYPERFKGTNISIYGKVVQKMVSGNNVALRVATSWGWDNVFYVNYKQSEIETAIIEDDWVTIYGESTGVYSYTALFGNEITISSMNAERIFIGNN